MIRTPTQSNPGRFQAVGWFLLALLICSATMARPAPLTAFTAEYAVLKDGERIGETTFTLRAGKDGHWRYKSSTRGTAGLAGLLGARVEETSHFRWNHGSLELLSHDYRLQATLYTQRRHLDVDWGTDIVRVEDSRKGTFEYAARPGLVDKHLLPLALVRHLDDGGQFSLPVAVHDRVQQQSFRVAGVDRVEVPAGNFNAVRVVRVDDDKHLSAWYVPDRYPIPVKLSQDGKDQLSLLLKSYRLK